MSIAFDSSTNGDWSSALSAGKNFNNVAGDILIGYAESGGGIGNIYQGTYNGVNLTQVLDFPLIGISGQRGTVWILNSPGTGVLPLIFDRVTNTGSGLLSFFGITLSGTRLTGQPENSNTSNATASTTLNGVVNTLTNNAMHVTIGRVQSGRTLSTVTAGATLRETQNLGLAFFFTKAGPASPGSDTIQMTASSSADITTIDLSITEFGQVPPVGGIINPFTGNVMSSIFVG